MLNNFLLKRKLKTKNLELSYLHKRIAFWKPLLFLLPSLAIIILFSIIPFIMAFQKSFLFETDSEIAQSETFGFEAFRYVLEDNTFLIGLRNSLLYGLLSLPITLVISILISSAIAHLYNKLARGFWQTVFFLPYVTNGVAIAASFVYFFDSQMGIVNELTGVKNLWLDSSDPWSMNPFIVILTNGVWSSLAFQVVLLTTAMLSVDKTLYKAASIDGASRLKQFFRITLPTIKGTLNLIITLGIIGGIRVFPIAIFQSDVAKAIQNGGATLMIYIYDQIGNSQYAIAGAATIFLFLIGVSFSFMMKSGIKLIINLSTRMGEKRVHNKVKNSKIYK
ncbi:sugar ABC transporter permease [Mycoplasma iguanae]|uniref:Sugar ABC transporter permease n=1 Tax=Mycoplasma iguanae TaxID=292461 RepID=A0ABY5R8B3_9MOLU|nr:sugar ABC transporter permease [Mycoplasma iguanae]UVD81723.1 sugar ABC transporter permease [Mycoplasma iguanae]